MPPTASVISAHAKLARVAGAAGLALAAAWLALAGDAAGLRAVSAGALLRDTTALFTASDRAPSPGNGSAPVPLGLRN